MHGTRAADFDLQFLLLHVVDTENASRAERQLRTTLSLLFYRFRLAEVVSERFPFGFVVRQDFI